MSDNKVNVYLDDIRGVPDEDGVWNDYDRMFGKPEEGTLWQVVRSVADTIALLETGEVAILSLDHDLGGGLGGFGTPDPDGCTGYDVLTWLEEQIAIHENLDVIPDAIWIHSDNASVYTKMTQAIESIMKKRDALLVQKKRAEE